MMDKLGFSINKVSDPRLATRNISDDSVVTKLVDYSDVDHCEGGANNEVVGQQRAFDVAKQFSVIANDWKEEKVTVNTP